MPCVYSQVRLIHIWIGASEELVEV